MTKKRILYFDMDGVLVDFQSGIDRLTDLEKEQYEGKLDDVPNIFSRMSPYDGAVDFVKTLSEHFDVYLLSTAPWVNPTALNDKLQFVKDYFGDVFYKRLILTHNKQLNIGDYLIDDRTKNGAGDFSGEHIHFGTDDFPDYQSVIDYLIK